MNSQRNYIKTKLVLWSGRSQIVVTSLMNAKMPESHQSPCPQWSWYVWPIASRSPERKPMWGKGRKIRLTPCYQDHFKAWWIFGNHVRHRVGLTPNQVNLRGTDYTARRAILHHKINVIQSPTQLTSLKLTYPLLKMMVSNKNLLFQGVI